MQLLRLCCKFSIFLSSSSIFVVFCFKSYEFLSMSAFSFLMICLFVSFSWVTSLNLSNYSVNAWAFSLDSLRSCWFLLKSTFKVAYFCSAASFSSLEFFSNWVKMVFFSLISFKKSSFLELSLSFFCLFSHSAYNFVSFSFNSLIIPSLASFYSLRLSIRSVFRSISVYRPLMTPSFSFNILLKSSWVSFIWTFSFWSLSLSSFCCLIAFSFP